MHIWESRKESNSLLWQNRRVSKQPQNFLIANAGLLKVDQKVLTFEDLKIFIKSQKILPVDRKEFRISYEYYIDCFNSFTHVLVKIIFTLLMNYLSA